MRTARWVSLGVGLMVSLAGCFAAPYASFNSAPGSGHAPLTVSFTAMSSFGGEDATSYEWSFGDGTGATGDHVDHAFDEKGEYLVVLQATASDGRRAQASQTLVVRSRVPHAEFTIVPFQAPVDHPIRFDASGSYDPDGEIASYHWDFGDGTEGEGERVDHVFPAQRIHYRVLLTVTDADGDFSQATGYVELLGCETCG